MLAILDGQGRARVQTLIFFIGLWIVTIPVAVLLFYGLGEGLVGIWLALLLGYLVAELLATAAVCTSDWQSIIEQAREHILLE
jgi:Na+-driven multidrug efflux pump